MINLHVSSGKIDFQGKEFSLDCPVEEAVLFKGVIIALLDHEHLMSKGLDENRNIVGLSMQGDVVWTVAERSRDWPTSQNNPFVGLRIWEDGTLHGITWSGLHYFIDERGRLTRDQAYK